MKRIVLGTVVFVFLGFVCSVSSHAQGSGTQGADTMRQGIGARTLAMGETFVGIADDINAVYYNPAGLGTVSRTQLSGTYLQGIAPDVYYGFFSCVLPPIGLSVMTLQGGEIEIDDGAGGMYTVQAQTDYVAGASYGMKLGEQLSLGMTAKVFQSTLLQDYTASAFAGDVGVLFGDKVRLGLVMQNIGTDVVYKGGGTTSTPDPLPSMLRAGLGYCTDTLTVGLDVISDSGEMREHAGIEFRLQSLVLRGGAKLGYKETYMSGGLGFNLDTFQIDYAMIIRDGTEITHYVSFTAGGGSSKEKTIYHPSRYETSPELYPRR